MEKINEVHKGSNIASQEFTALFRNQQKTPATLQTPRLLMMSLDFLIALTQLPFQGNQPAENTK